MEGDEQHNKFVMIRKRSGNKKIYNKFFPLDDGEKKSLLDLARSKDIYMHIYHIKMLTAPK
jgi:hypothetical protein